MSNSEIERQAAEWFAKVDGGNLSPLERSAFDAWLAADIRHLGAFARYAAAVSNLDPLSAIGSDEVRRRCQDATHVSWTRRRIVLAGTGTAALAAAAGFAGLVLWSDTHKEPAGARPNLGSQSEYATEIGRTRVVPLADGSVMTLNTNSKVTVKFAERLREIHLMKGEALFNVAKDKARPFVVFVGATQVRAVGTSFTVRYTEKQPIRILVQEGVVAVTRDNSPRVRPVLAIADTQTLVPQNAPITTQSVTYAQLTRGIAWQYGQIFFDNDTLADAAEEFARYSNIKIKIDPAVSTRTVTGLFPSDNPVGFAKAAASALDLRVVVGVGVVEISK